MLGKSLSNLLNKYGKALLFLFLFKTFYFGALTLALLTFSSIDNKVSIDCNDSKLSNNFGSYSSHFKTWDAEFYLYLANHEYEIGDYRCAFYPLYPWLIKLVSYAMGGNTLLSAIIASNLCSLFGELILFITIEKRKGQRIAWITLLLCITFPGSIFFQFAYTESLFFFLLMLLIYGLDQGEFNIACIAAFLLPLTRAIGIFCVVPIFWHLISTGDFGNKSSFARRKLASDLKSSDIAPSKRQKITLFATLNWHETHYRLLLAPIYGWAAYFVQMWIWTGDPFQGYEAQSQFHCESIRNIFDIGHFVAELFMPTCIHGFSGSFFDRSVFIFVLFTLSTVWRADKTWFILTLLIGIVPAMSGTFVSYTRFASILFPVYFGLAILLGKSDFRYRYLTPIVLCLFVVGHVFLLWRFVNGIWAG